MSKRTTIVDTRSVYHGHDWIDEPCGCSRVELNGVVVNGDHCQKHYLLMLAEAEQAQRRDTR